MALQSLPAEMLFKISDNLSNTSDIHGFSLGNKRLNHILKGDLYHHDAQTNKEALKWAIINGELNTAKLAIAGGTDVNGWQMPNRPFEIPIILAAASGSVEITRLLLEKCAFVNRRSDEGNSALMSCDFSNTELVQLLIDGGARTRYDKEEEFGDTCGILYRAIDTANAEVLRLLVQSGASVQQEGLQLVISACQSRNAEGLAFLMEDEMFQKPQEQMKVIAKCVYLGDTGSLQWLLEQGVKPWSKSTDGAFELVRTALSADDGTTLKLLQQHGLDIGPPEADTLQALEIPWADIVEDTGGGTRKGTRKGTGRGLGK